MQFWHYQGEKWPSDKKGGEKVLWAKRLGSISVQLSVKHNCCLKSTHLFSQVFSSNINFFCSFLSFLSFPFTRQFFWLKTQKGSKYQTSLVFQLLKFILFMKISVLVWYSYHHITSLSYINILSEFAKIICIECVLVNQKPK